MRDERTWSLLDTKPVLLYLKKHDEYIVYWNGIAMTHSQAFNLAMEYCGIYATPEMKTAMRLTYEKLYYAEAFKTRAWDSRVDGGDIYGALKSWMREHLVKHVKDRDPKEVLKWFEYSRARIEE